MIKLKHLLSEIKSPYIVVGMVGDDDLEVVSANNVESHMVLIDKYPEWASKYSHHWRFNGNDQTLYWYQQPTEKMVDAVKLEIKKKYPHYYVTKQKHISSNDVLNYQKLQQKAHGVTEGTQEEDKIELIKSMMSQLTDDTLFLAIHNDDAFPQANYVQVDEISDGQNHFSSNPETMNKLGYKMPSSKELLTLPMGRYKLADAKKRLGKV